jgi:GTP cyclohydrolase II
VPESSLPEVTLPEQSVPTVPTVPEQSVPTSPTVPGVTVRRRVRLPLRLADGWRGTAEAVTFDGLADGRDHVALALGPWQDALARSAAGGRPPLVRLHSECLTGDVFGSERCDCGPQLHEALERTDRAGGFVLYLRHEGRGIGLVHKLDAYALQDGGLDTYEANVALGHAEDERDYQPAAAMLAALGAHRVTLLTNNPDKVRQLRRHGIVVTEQVPTGLHLTAANKRYLAAKARRGEHLFPGLAAG